MTVFDINNLADEQMFALITDLVSEKDSRRASSVHPSILAKYYNLPERAVRYAVISYPRDTLQGLDDRLGLTTKPADQRQAMIDGYLHISGSAPSDEQIEKVAGEVMSIAAAHDASRRASLAKIGRTPELEEVMQKMRSLTGGRAITAKTIEEGTYSGGHEPEERRILFINTLSTYADNLTDEELDIAGLNRTYINDLRTIELPQIIAGLSEKRAIEEKRIQHEAQVAREKAVQERLALAQAQQDEFEQRRIAEEAKLALEKAEQEVQDAINSEAEKQVLDKHGGSDAELACLNLRPDDSETFGSPKWEMYLNCVQDHAENSNVEDKDNKQEQSEQAARDEYEYTDVANSTVEQPDVDKGHEEGKPLESKDKKTGLIPLVALAAYALLTR